MKNEIRLLAIGDVKRSERDAETGHGACEETLGEHATFSLAVNDERDGGRRSARGAEEHSIDGLAFVSGQTDV